LQVLVYGPVTADKSSVKQTRSLCVVLGIVWALLIPSLALADDATTGNNNVGADARSCVVGSNNPHCSAPEVPIAALYPALGGLSFAAIGIVRARRRRSDDD
jgi:hypothetical protein